MNGQPPSWSSGADVGFTYIEAKGRIYYHKIVTDVRIEYAHLYCHVQVL